MLGRNRGFLRRRCATTALILLCGGSVLFFLCVQPDDVLNPRLPDDTWCQYERYKAMFGFANRQAISNYCLDERGGSTTTSLVSQPPSPLTGNTAQKHHETKLSLVHLPRVSSHLPGNMARKEGQRSPRNTILKYSVKPELNTAQHYHVLTEQIPSAPPDFELMLKQRASTELVLSIVDTVYAEFALNFYETSLKKYSIDNFLLVCLERAAKVWLAKHNIDCYYYPLPAYANSTKSQMARGDFGTAGYYLKTNMKTLVMLHTINAGYNVLLVDLDIVFLKNPLNHLKCTDCDIQIQQDRVHLNSGFVYARATNSSRALYTTAWQKYLQYQKSHDQAYVNMAMGIFGSENIPIKIERLSPRLFPCGAYYFTTPTFWRMFADDPCKECVIVHNNYIGSTAAKRYRFKENKLWTVDVDGYYSDRNAKYLLYENPYYFGDKTGAMEREALRSALAIANITGRIVILPRFHCCDCQRKTCGKSRQQCSLLTVLKLRTFDENFGNQYRENSFLGNPKVPQKIRSLANFAMQKGFVIRSSAYNNTQNSLIKLPSSVTQLNPKRPKEGASQEEIRAWFDTYQEKPILAFHSLYGAFHQFSDYQEETRFQIRVQRGFQCTSYDQWEVKDKWW